MLVIKQIHKYQIQKYLRSTVLATETTWTVKSKLGTVQPFTNKCHPCSQSSQPSAQERKTGSKGLPVQGSVQTRGPHREQQTDCGGRELGAHLCVCREFPNWKTKLWLLPHTDLLVPIQHLSGAV